MGVESNIIGMVGCMDTYQCRWEMTHRKSIQVEAIGPNVSRRSYGRHGANSYAKSISSRRVKAIQWNEGGSLFRMELIDGTLKLIQAITNLGFKGKQETDWDVIWSKKLI